MKLEEKNFFFPPKEQEKQVKMGNAEDAYGQLSFCSKPSRGLRALAQKQILKSFGGSWGIRKVILYTRKEVPLFHVEKTLCYMYFILLLTEI